MTNSGFTFKRIPDKTELTEKLFSNFKDFAQDILRMRCGRNGGRGWRDGWECHGNLS
jgi:hypothetical protein